MTWLRPSSPVPCEGKQEAAQTQQIFQTLTTENVNSPMLE